MKLKLIAILLVTLSAPVQADDPSIVCVSIGELAENVMKGRQLGIPQRSVTALMANLDDPNVRQLGQAMVEDAYSVARHSSDSQRTKEAIMFSAKWEMVCDMALEGRK
jgi:hypothetical protein